MVEPDRASSLAEFQVSEKVDQLRPEHAMRGDGSVARHLPVGNADSLRFQVEDVRMTFTYADTWEKAVPEAYERLLMDVIRGDPTLFTRSDEVEAAWRIVDPILQAWEGRGDSPLYFYEAGSWGPQEAESLLLEPGTEWHVPNSDGVN